mmetsp:Transcript_3332/g.6679  ORF Transcript_3332/g.6679 Transcript_3332/m.6679 type:complete len:592 (-) Transcript_3332:61-1836(-)|eukprot:CAMPEP_0173385432 /NCGR_PEP_ID=MMETSP1356-20130122/8041_1 /TAXON_ID=77927 ORGANISM="Hemiselmis virescens, Strain PCC157" /NCGR_SAMPLE_ID=MMETSP1356 /ASSEMBLY_ACC=CAM_ASM_000847 /LENGTH=591 /DNA_ID=CAMNT_0014341233 /DNA_START=17 /DNA_END=1792 /DNA_ORIENTATION=+
MAPSNVVVALSAATGVAVTVMVLRSRAAAARKAKKNPPVDTGAGIPEDQVCKQGFKPSLVPKDLDMIIIGSGVSGLMTACLMAKQGKTVLVLEQHDQAGGNLHTFEEQGWEFDTGLHYVGNMGPKSNSRRLVDYCCDGTVDWAPMSSVYDTAVFRSEEVQRNMTASVREEYRMRSDEGARGVAADMKKWFPGEEKAIDEYFRLCREATRGSKSILIRNMLPRPLSWLFGWMFDSSLKLFYKTTEEVLSSLTKNRKLIGVMTYMWGDYGEPPSRSAFGIHALLQTHYCPRGAYYPVGGPTVLSRAMVRTIEKRGGKVLARAAVESITVSRGGYVTGVTMKSGDVLTASTVVSTVGITQTYSKLLPAAHQWRVRHELRKIPSLRSDMTLSSLFVGIRGGPPMPATNTWVLPSYDHDGELGKLREDPLHDRTVMFISFASAKDPTYAARHPGLQTCQVCAPSFYPAVEKYADKRVKKRGAEYEAYKQVLKLQMLKGLLREFPELEGRIGYTDVGTAVTNDYYLGTTRGAIYGLPHTPERFRSKWLRARTPIGGLFLSGQDVLFCGIIGAAYAAVLTSCSMSWNFLVGKGKDLLV